MLVILVRRATIALGCLLAVAACEPDPAACDRPSCRCPDGGGCPVPDAGRPDTEPDGGPMVAPDAGGPACAWSADCGRGLVCVDGACHTPATCEAGSACPAPLLCDAERSACAECLADEHCPAGDLCRAFVCMPAPDACDSDADCAGVGRWCALDLRHCVACRTAAECEAGFFCSADFRCLPHSCEPERSVCEDDATRWVCRDDGSGHDSLPCADGEGCVEGACAERSWVTRVGTVAGETARAGALLDDGTLVAVSSRNGEGSETYLTAVDPTGALRWALIVSPGFGSSLWPTGTASVSGGLVVVGHYRSQDAFVAKVSGDGELLWARTVSYAGQWFNVEGVAAVSGGMLLAGNLRPDGSSNEDAFVAKLDDAGDVLWARRFSGTGGEWLARMIPLSDGSAIVLGRTSSFGAGNSDGLAIKVDGAGDMTWANAYGTASGDNLSAGLQLAGGDVVAFGNASPQSMVLRVNEEGRLVWGRRFSGEDETVATYAMSLSTADEIVTLGARWSDGRLPTYPVATRWTLDGDMLAATQLPLGSYHQAVAFGRTRGDGFWAAFETRSSPGPWSPAMARLEDDLTTPCGSPDGSVPVRVDYEPITATSGGSWTTMSLTSAAVSLATRRAGLAERACTE